MGKHNKKRREVEETVNQEIEELQEDEFEEIEDEPESKRLKKEWKEVVKK